MFLGSVFDDNGGMVAGFLPAPGLGVDGTGDSPLVERLREVMVIDAPAHVASVGGSPVIPPAKVTALVGEFAKAIGQPYR